jgi:hypothetical protein
MNDIQWTEIYLLGSVLIVFLCFLYLLLFKAPKILKSHKKEDPAPAPPQKILEVFDYLGTKIIHENGTYTVNHKGRIGFYKTWDNLPTEYKKMVKELDSRSLEEKSGEDYFLEIINGLYYLTMPGGKKKKFNSLNEIPPDIRKALGK